MWQKCRKNPCNVCIFLKQDWQKCQRILIVQVSKHLDHGNPFQFKFKFMGKYLDRWLTLQILNAGLPHLKKIDPNMVTNAPWATGLAFALISIYG